MKLLQAVPGFDPDIAREFRCVLDYDYRLARISICAYPSTSGQLLEHRAAVGIAIVGRIAVVYSQYAGDLYGNGIDEGRITRGAKPTGHIAEPDDGRLVPVGV